MTILDVQTNWRRWNGWINGRGEPDACDGIEPIMLVDRAVLVTDPFEISEMRDWIAANIGGRVEFYGRWDFNTHAFRIVRQRIGLNMVFASPDEAFHAKMRWF